MEYKEQNKYMQYIRVQLKSFKEVLNICQNENKNDHIILNILMLNMIDNLQKANNSNSNIKYIINTFYLKISPEYNLLSL